MMFWQVSVPKGSLCNITVRADIGLPPDAIYNIVTDPDNKRVFKNIKVNSHHLSKHSLINKHLIVTTSSSIISTVMFFVF